MALSLQSIFCMVVNRETTALFTKTMKLKESIITDFIYLKRFFTTLYKKATVCDGNAVNIEIHHQKHMKKTFFFYDMEN